MGKYIVRDFKRNKVALTDIDNGSTFFDTEMEALENCTDSDAPVCINIDTTDYSKYDKYVSDNKGYEIMGYDQWKDEEDLGTCYACKSQLINPICNECGTSNT